MGVPIYWLNGNKVADNYADFYDGTWDDEANPKQRNGNSVSASLFWTGSSSHGTGSTTGQANDSVALGDSQVTIGRLNGAEGPLDARFSAAPTNTLRYYALSQVFTVGDSEPVFTESEPTSRVIAENITTVTNVGTPVAATDADTSDTLVYSLSGTDAASFTIISTSGQIQTKSGGHLRPRGQAKLFSRSQCQRQL